MAYTAHNWQNGDSGVSAAAWLNNMEEGVRAATQTAEDTAADYDAADAGTVYSRAQALQASATEKLQLANTIKTNLTVEQAKLTARNTYLMMRNGVAGTGTGVIIGSMSRFEVGAFPDVATDSTRFIVSQQGYYLFMINAGVCGPYSRIRIRKNYITVETLKLMNFQDVTTAQERAIVSTCVVKYLLANDRIDFLMDQDGSGSSLSGFRVAVRKL